VRILQLKLFCRSPDALVSFYKKLLGDERVDLRRRCWQAGSTLVEFERTQTPVPYHFALNVSCNKIEKAVEFLKRQGISIITYDGKNIVEFPNWNARSVYFLDPAGNIVEFIARSDLNNEKSGEFGGSDIVSVSEVGTPCSDVGETFSLLSRHTGIDKYDGNLSSFCAAGDPEGLFIITGTDRDWFPTEIPSLPAQYEMTAEIKGDEYRLAYDGNAIMILL